MEKILPVKLIDDVPVCELIDFGEELDSHRRPSVATQEFDPFAILHPRESGDGILRHVGYKAPVPDLSDMGAGLVGRDSNFSASSAGIVGGSREASVVNSEDEASADRVEDTCRLIARATEEMFSGYITGPSSHHVNKLRRDLVKILRLDVPEGNSAAVLGPGEEVPVKKKLMFGGASCAISSAGDSTASILRGSPDNLRSMEPPIMSVLSRPVSTSNDGKFASTPREPISSSNISIPNTYRAAAVSTARPIQTASAGSLLQPVVSQPVTEQRNFLNTAKTYSPEFSSAGDLTADGLGAPRLVSTPSHTGYRREESLKDSQSLLLAALNKLDSRQVPRPEAYDDTCGQSFEQFLGNFEEYCRQNFKGSPNLWVGELAPLLSGHMRRAYETLKVPGDTYPILRNKLQRWQFQNKDTIEQDTRDRFNHAGMLDDESCRLYAGRLEKLYRLAFPQKASKIENSRSLQRKIIDTVPEEFSKQLKTARALNKGLRGTDLSWSEVLALASQFDADQKLYQPRDKEREVWVTYQPTASLEPTQIWKAEKSKSSEGAVQQTPGENPEFKVQPSAANSRAQQFLERETRRCYHCDKIGHLRSNCYRLLNQCLKCGSDEHRIADCPDRARAGAQRTAVTRNLNNTNSRTTSVLSGANLERAEGTNIRQLNFQEN